MSRVGILTFHWANHYGAVLQAYALQSLLKGLSQEATIINFEPALSLVVSSTIMPNKLGRKYKVLSLPISKTLRCIAGEVTYYLPFMLDELTRARAFDEYRRGVLGVRSKTIKDLDELRHECSKYSAIVVGSDQVWNPEYLKYSDYVYLLPFNLGNVLKIGFSASIGVKTSTIPQNIITLYRKCLKEFSIISLRENTHVKWLSEVLGREVYHTLDPTLLVNREDFEKISSSYEPLSEDYILFYNLDSSILPFVDDLEEMLGLPVLIYKKPIIREWGLYSKWAEGKKSFYHVGPGEFIDLLANAKFVFTDSFHGLALSVLFEKPVLVAIQGRASKVKSRIEDLVRLLGLEEIVIKSRDDIRRALRIEIDYRDVKSRLSKSKKTSLDLLKNAFRHYNH